MDSEMFNTASGLDHVVNLLKKELEQSSGDLVPHQDGSINPKILGLICSQAVSRALSIEIILKAIIRQATGEKAKNIHNHQKLFDKIPESVKEKYKQEYDSLAKEYNANNEAKISLDITDVFEATKNSFVIWRYVYEPESLGEEFPIKEAELVYTALTQ